MIEDVFEKLGLSRGEAKVYSSLLNLGESTITPISTNAQVTKSKIYEILEKLIKKGLVGYNIKQNTKHFFANDPRKIISFLENKEEELRKNKQEIESIMPSLLKQRDEAISGRIAEIYQGYDGMRAVREELILTCKKGEDFLVLGAPKVANEKWEGWLLDFHKKRISRGVGMKIIYNWDSKEYGVVRTKMKLTEVRYFQQGINSPTWIDVFPEVVMLSIITGNDVISFVIRSREIANSFKTYFEMLWKQVKE